MQTSVLCLALLMVASVVTARPPSFDDTSIQQDESTPLASVTPCRPSGGGDGASAEEGADALGDAFHQVSQWLLRLQEEEAERKAQEALRLQEQSAAAALREAVSQMAKERDEALRALRGEFSARIQRGEEALRLQEQRAAAALREAVSQLEQERDEAIRTLRGEFSSRMQMMEERMNLVEGQLISSPTTAKDTAVGVQVLELEKRVIKLEVNDKRPIEQEIPCVDVLIALLERCSPEGAPSDIPPPSKSPRQPIVSAPGTTATGGAEADALQEGDAAEEQRAKERVELRIREVEAKRDRARAAPSTVEEDLCEAAFNGRLEVVRRLLDSGADVNYTNSQGQTPLISAVFGNDGDVVSLLLEKGADVNAIDISGWSPLHYATFFDYTSGHIVALLIDAGADVDARTENGINPLHWAARWNNLSAVQALLAADARKSLKSWSGRWKNKTPSDVAESDAIRDLLRP